MAQRDRSDDVGKSGLNYERAVTWLRSGTSGSDTGADYKHRNQAQMRLPAAVLLTISLSACSHMQVTDPARYELSVVVIYADRNTINAEARNRGYRSQANGFYDPARNELWCPNEETAEAFRTCGHELRHAIKGDFHTQSTTKPRSR
jgi:hypothetical protein